ncbi:unnamed protein product [Oncorhynchus mykiss]|uniref:Mediator of RNA polymerase II transcription subunit 24 n=1 Tax=Oncorhynchus mykiss TaxID=8022 RepID=A0A060VV27_ONCMY|nr:unnamed protein product [Oncorhynchus mykiss]
MVPVQQGSPSERLLSSNEEEPVVLSSLGDRSMSTSLSASQLHTVNMRDPLNHVLANLFLLISSVLGSKTAGPHIQFVQSFMKECVECLEQGSCGSILQFHAFHHGEWERGELTVGEMNCGSLGEGEYAHDHHCS